MTLSVQAFLAQVLTSSTLSEAFQPEVFVNMLNGMDKTGQDLVRLNPICPKVPPKSNPEAEEAGLWDTGVEEIIGTKITLSGNRHSNGFGGSVVLTWDVVSGETTLVSTKADQHFAEDLAVVGFWADTQEVTIDFTQFPIFGDSIVWMMTESDGNIHLSTGNHMIVANDKLRKEAGSDLMDRICRVEKITSITLAIS